MQIWDTSGQERFRTIAQAYYKGSKAVILVYSVVDKKSFTNITYWMNQIKQFISEIVCVMLIGNKIDDFNRQVSYEEGEMLAAQFGIPFFETSAQEGINVDDAFYALGKLLKEQRIPQKLDQNQFEEKVQPIEQEQYIDEYNKDYLIKPIDQEQQVDEQMEDYLIKKSDQKQEVETLVKFIIIGDSGVGKTYIFSRLCDDLQHYFQIKTIETDFNCNAIEAQNSEITLQLWDTNDQDINNIQINQ